MSKPDLKHSGTFFRKIACDIGFAAYQIFRPKGPCGHIKGALLQNIQKKAPLREYLANPFIIYIYIIVKLLFHNSILLYNFISPF